MSTGVHGPTRARIEAKTLRTDRWWVYPLTTFVVFTAFVIYATIRAFMGSHYYQAPYLSPLYSPCLGDCVKGSSDFGQPFGWWPLSAALIVLIFPLGFRMSCYYYRKAYSGETRLPLILNNIHRYFWYAAVVVSLILTYDTVLTFRDEHDHWFHMGLGSLVFLVNIVLIWLYTLSCHSCRHVVGGRLRHFSKHPVRYKAWTWVSKLNTNHARFAWLSLFSVAFADLYVLLISSGAFSDPRFF
jgi:hypothetical protein